jgi:hypothetical protein
MSKSTTKARILAEITNATAANSVTPTIVGTIIDEVLEVNDNGKLLLVTSSGDEVTPIFIFPHGLSYTPTMVLATGNTMDTLSFFDGFNHYPLLFFAFADSTNITISYQNYDYYPKVPKIGLNNLKWTVLCK